MSTITVTYTDGSVEEYPETSRCGGSWCTSHKFEGGFCIIKDAWGNTTGIPSDIIKKVESR